MIPLLIGLEEHYYSPSVYSSLEEKFRKLMGGVPGLLELDEKRLADMDRGNTALQVVSHAFTPGGPSARDCHEGNDELAAAISKSPAPNRFAAFAVLPISDPKASARELRRTVTSLGFVGALTENHAHGKHFDGLEYDVLWEAACALDVPIYLHPSWPTLTMAERFDGNFPKAIAANLGAAGWGWHSDVGLHIIKLYCAGVFDRFPSLKIIIGHMGEMLPFMLERCYFLSVELGGWGKQQRGFRHVWNENIWVTTSGCWSLAPLKCILENTKVERIMYSLDYPFESVDKGRQWFETLKTSGLLTAEQLDMIAHGNAEKLLKIQSQKSGTK